MGSDLTGLSIPLFQELDLPFSNTNDGETALPFFTNVRVQIKFSNGKKTERMGSFRHSVTRGDPGG